MALTTDQTPMCNYFFPLPAGEVWLLLYHHAFQNTILPENNTAIKYIRLESVLETYHRLPRTKSGKKLNDHSTNGYLYTTVKVQDI